MTKSEQVTHLSSLISLLVKCRRLMEHGEIVSDEQFAALIKARDELIEKPIDSGGAHVVEETRIV